MGELAQRLKSLMKVHQITLSTGEPHCASEYRAIASMSESAASDSTYLVIRLAANLLFQGRKNFPDAARADTTFFALD